MGWQEPVTDEEFEWYFNQMITAESATSAGPILKLARWESVQECLQYKKPHFVLGKPILLEMGGGVDQMLDDIQSN